MELTWKRHALGRSEQWLAYSLEETMLPSDLKDYHAPNERAMHRLEVALWAAMWLAVLALGVLLMHLG